MARTGRPAAPVSFAMLAICVAGAGVLCLALTGAAVALLPFAPAGRAAVALVGLVLTVVAMGVTSSRITDRAIRAEFGDEPGGESGHDEGSATEGLG